MKIIGEIPARIGSKRVPKKNLKLINGKPLIWYAIEAAKQCDKIDNIYVNTDSFDIGKVGIDNGVGFYERRKELATDDIVSDQFNYDFFINTGADIVVMINPVSPLIEGKDITDALSFFFSGKYDTVISVKNEKMQSFYLDNPINFDKNGLLPKTQDLSPVQICSWAICVWKRESFVESFEEKGYAVFSGKVGFFPLSPLKAIKISTEEDFLLAEALLTYRDIYHGKI